MIFVERPSDFNPKNEIVSCYLIHNGEFVLLHRLPHKAQGNTWGVPAGKLEPGEEPIQGLLREVKEETGVALIAEALRHFKTVYVRYPADDFIYHMFSTEFDTRPSIEIKPDEHQAFVWTTPSNALDMDLIADLDWCINDFFAV